MLMLKNFAWVGVVLALVAMIFPIALYQMEYHQAADANSVFATFFDPTQPTLFIHHLTLALSVFWVVFFYVASFKVKLNRLAVTLVSIVLLLLLITDLVWDSRCALCPKAGGNQNILLTLHFTIDCVVLWLWYWLSLRMQNRIVIHSNAPLLRFFSIVAGIALLLLTSNINFLSALSGRLGGKFSQALQSSDTLSALIAVFQQSDLLMYAAFSMLLLIALTGYTLLTQRPTEIRRAGVSLGFLLVLVVLSGLLQANATVVTPLIVLLMLPLIAICFYARYRVVDIEAKYVPTIPQQVERPKAATGEPVTSIPVKRDQAVDYVEPAPESLYLRLKSQLKRTRTGLGGVLSSLHIGQRKIDAALLEEIEASLIMADIGMDATSDIIARLTEKTEREQLNNAEALSIALKQELLEMLQPCSLPLVIPKQDTPFVILVVGVNGAGKTTTIGKLAKRLQAQGHSVMLAAGDTFRAAAVEQLQVWGERNHIHVVAQHTGADSASVIYDGVQSALAKGVDVLIADTAGRLQTKSNLMEELKKIKRIMGKLDNTAPHEVLLVLDSGTGQNAISQTKIFNEAVALTGLVLTKLDGTAKGGIIFALAKQFGLPIRFIGIGEGIDDLQDFDATTFVDALFVKDE